MAFSYVKTYVTRWKGRKVHWKLLFMTIKSCAIDSWWPRHSDSVSPWNCTLGSTTFSLGPRFLAQQECHVGRHFGDILHLALYPSVVPWGTTLKAYSRVQIVLVLSLNSFLLLLASTSIILTPFWIIGWHTLIVRTRFIFVCGIHNVGVQCDPQCVWKLET